MQQLQLEPVLIHQATCLVCITISKNIVGLIPIIKQYNLGIFGCPFFCYSL
jgi:hypothetical protein